MSSLAIGQVLSVPDGAVSWDGAEIGMPVGAAIGLAAVGVGICVVGATRAVIAGSQAIRQVCQAHAAQRRALHGLNASVQRVRTQQPTLDSAAWSELLRRARQAQARQAEWVGRQIEMQATSQPEASGIAAAAPRMLGPTPVHETRLVDALDRVKHWDVLDGRRRGALDVLAAYELDGAWQGLFAADRLAGCREELEQVRACLDGKSQRLAEAEVILDKVSFELNRMQREAPERWLDRKRALRSMQAAAAQLDQALSQASTQPERHAELQVLQASLEAAQAAFSRLDFAEAEAQAESARLQAEHLSQAEAEPRRAYLLETLAALEKELDGHNNRAMTKVIAGLVESARERLAKGALDRAEELLHEACQAADTLLTEIETERAPAAVRDRLAQLAVGQLEKMKYVVSEERAGASFPQTATDDACLPAAPGPQPTAAERRILVGRKGQREFRVTITPDGALWCDLTRGYQGRECDEIKDFIQGLKDQGVVGVWESNYTLEQTAACLRDVLSAEGYDAVQEEPLPDGSGLRITTLGHPVPQTAAVTWNGSSQDSLGETDRAVQPLPSGNFLHERVRRDESHLRDIQQRMLRR